MTWIVEWESWEPNRIDRARHRDIVPGPSDFDAREWAEGIAKDAATQRGLESHQVEVKAHAEGYGLFVNGNVERLLSIPKIGPRE
jgi:hypothetical protein